MILDQIISNTLNELEHRKHTFPIAELQRRVFDQPPPLDFASALLGKSIKLIAEVKKASPSKGIICSNFNPVEIAMVYADNGASAISVLTESHYFQGSLEYLKNIKTALSENKIPLLRKDFILNSYQIYESRAWGADSILLIVAILKPEKLQELLELSHELNMNCLVEVHNESEIETALKCKARIIGINNRDLMTFNVDLATTDRLKPLIPGDKTIVSESGIKSSNDIKHLENLGVNAVLVGEYLMSTPDIAARMKELV